METILRVPVDATWDDIQECVNFVAGVGKGLRELDEGKGISHQKLKEDFAEWLTS